MNKADSTIAGMNASRAQYSQPPLTPRQVHLVREFILEDQEITPEDAGILHDLLMSNSA
jgi:hypothetical protein